MMISCRCRFLYPLHDDIQDVVPCRGILAEVQRIGSAANSRAFAQRTKLDLYAPRLVIVEPIDEARQSEYGRAQTGPDAVIVG